MWGKKNDASTLPARSFDAIPPFALNDETTGGVVVPEPNRRQLHKRFTVLRHRFA
jgi:hypothetical protein